MVDDLICRGEFSLTQIERFMDSHTDVECFSLRLGRNINSGRQPSFESPELGILAWNTSRDLVYTWKYFWELSSSIYRQALVREYLRRCDPQKIDYPNPFESHYYSCMPSFAVTGLAGAFKAVQFLLSNKKNRMACFEDSKCFTQGVNLVAKRKIDYEPIHDPLELHRKLEQGYVVDFRRLREIKNISPNAGPKYFRIIKEKEMTETKIGTAK